MKIKSALMTGAMVLIISACGGGGGSSDGSSSSDKAITAFSFPTSPVSTGDINEAAKTINVTVPYGTNVTNLTPSVTHTGASYSPTGAQDFTASKTYTVTADDSTTAAYTVTVSFPIVQWARSVQSSTNSSGFHAVAVDSSGNVYAAGEQNGGTVTYGSGVSVSGSYSGSNSVLVKYNSSGTAQWARSVESSSDLSLFFSVAVDSSGNVYAAGLHYQKGSYNYGNGITVSGSSSYNNVVLVKYNSSGTPQWARSVSTGTSYSNFSAVAVDSSGNVYAAGSQYGSGSFTYGPGVSVAGITTSMYDANVVLVKYNSSGTAQWARSVTAGTDKSGFGAIAIDSSGNVYVTGSQYGSGSFTYGTGVSVAGSYSGTDASNAVLVKYNSSGTALWARSVTAGTDKSGFGAIAIDSSGNVYVAGSQYGSGSFTYGTGVSVAGSYSGSYPYNAVLVKYNSSGTAQWARSVQGATNQSRFSEIAVDSLGNVYAAGYQAGTGSFTYGAGVSVAGSYSAGDNILLVKYNPSGTAQWALSVKSSTNYSSFSSVAVDSSNNVYAAGSQNGISPCVYDTGISVSGSYAPGWSPVLVKYYP